MPEILIYASFIQSDMNNHDQKGAAMNTGMQTDVWIYRTIIVLGSIYAVSVVGIITLAIMGQPMPENLVALGAVAAAGLVRLLFWSLNRGLFG
jgi:hypothetical protein